MPQFRSPGFWWNARAGAAARLLAPASALYGAVSGRRLARGARVEASLPVLCVGNFTAGGAGKTPTALALGRAALDLGLSPAFLSRGYGREDGTPLLVDPERHGAREAGDEPLLLARLAPTAVAADRAAGAALLRERIAPDILIMDDGFQSARLRADFSLLVVDGRRAFGNGRVLPAGPLRAPLAIQLARASAVLIVGDGPAGEAAAARAAEAGLPVHRARLAVERGEAFAGRRVLAFSGIADPEKFRRSLQEAGAIVAASRDFPDHHPFTDAQLQALTREAEELSVLLATTAKDRARISGLGAFGRDFAAGLHVLDVSMVFADARAPGRLVAAAVERFRRDRA